MNEQSPAQPPLAQPKPPAQPAASTTPPVPSVATKQQAPASTTPVPVKDEGKRTRRFFIGCCSAFGCSLLLFLALIFIFIAVGGTTENPIFSLFGVSGPEVVNVIIMITNLIFGLLSFVAFVVMIIGAFKFVTTKKEDKENRKKAAFLTFGTLAILFIFIFLWIFAYLYLSSQRVSTPREDILTEPLNTIDLTAPVTIKFNATSLPISQKRFEILTYRWDFGDGEERTGNALQVKTYEDKGRKGGRFDVTLTVAVREKATGREAEEEFPRIVTITNERAKLVVDAKPKSGEVPLTVKFDASKSYDPDGESLQSFRWDFNEDGKFDDAESEKVNFTFDKIGTYKVTLQVAESNGETTEASITIEVIASQQPLAVISLEAPDGIPEAPEDTLYINTQYTFSGAQSSAPSGKIEKYDWNFGDGSSKKTTRVATHTYTTAGKYELVLKVTDATGRVGEAAKAINVVPLPKAPEPKVKTTPEVVNGKIAQSIPIEVSFDASQSTDPDNDIVEYRWDFENDGTVDSNDVKASHTYDKVGNFEAVLTLVDSDGNESKWKVIIEAKLPGFQAKLQASPGDGEVPLTVLFDASGSIYPGSRIVAYEWDFGDGTEQKVDVSKITHQYRQIGTFTAKVTVVGLDNKKSEAALQIHVRGISLKACFTPSPEDGKAPLAVLFDPSCSTGSVARYHWTVGELGESRDRKPTFTFTQAGTYTVILEVADNQNVLNTFSKKIIVTE